MLPHFFYYQGLLVVLAVWLKAFDALDPEHPWFSFN
jgi:hypothetical protein